MNKNYFTRKNMKKVVGLAAVAGLTLVMSVDDIVTKDSEVRFKPEVHIKMNVSSYDCYKKLKDEFPEASDSVIYEIINKDKEYFCPSSFR